jgi:hypothetical protein
MHMRKSAPRILFTLLLLVEAGCGRESDAASREGNPASRTTISTASAVPEASPVSGGVSIDLSAIQITIQEIDAIDVVDDRPRETVTLVPLCLKVSVTSNQDGPRPRVDFRRFALRTDNGVMFPARASTTKSPRLAPTYLQKGASVSGWLTFEVPSNAESFILWSDLRNPPIQINVEVSGAR